MGRYKLTPVGAIALVALVVGLLLLILGSSEAVQIVGLVIALCALLPVVGGVTGSQRMAGWVRPPMDHDISRMSTAPAAEPAPEYVEENPEASEDVWEHERELYREKEEREQHDREEREHQQHSEPQP